MFYKIVDKLITDLSPIPHDKTYISIDKKMKVGDLWDADTQTHTKKINAFYYQIIEGVVVGTSPHYSTGFIQIEKRMQKGDLWDGEKHTPKEHAPTPDFELAYFEAIESLYNGDPKKINFMDEEWKSCVLLKNFNRLKKSKTCKDKLLEAFPQSA